jgi:hypothetical protein
MASPAIEQRYSLPGSAILITEQKYSLSRSFIPKTEHNCSIMGIVLPGSEYLCSVLGMALSVLYRPVLVPKDYIYTKGMGNIDYKAWTKSDAITWTDVK